MAMETVVQIDLAKYPIKYILGVLLLFLTIIASFGEKSHAVELNHLPPDRNELTSITGTELTSDGNTVKGVFYIDCIFDITADQHIRFMRLGLQGDGFNITLNTTGDVRPHKASLKEIEMEFDPPVSGTVKAQLMRGKAVLNSSEFTLSRQFNRGNRSEISTNGKISFGRHVNVSNVCWNGRSFMYFGHSQWSLDEPLVKFNGNTVLSGQKAQPAVFDEYVTFKNISNVLAGVTLVVSLEQYDPMNWTWMTRTAAPLAALIHEYQPSQVLALQGTTIGYLEKLGKISLVQNEQICTEVAVVEHMRKSPESAKLLKKMLVKPDTEVLDRVVLLLSNKSNFTVTNLEDLAAGVCEHCVVERLVAENESIDSIIEKVSRARVVIAPHSPVVSQALWAQGTLIELIPENAECVSWTYDVSRAAGIKHLRFSVGSATKLAPETKECEYDEHVGSFQGEVAVSIPPILAVFFKN